MARHLTLDIRDLEPPELLDRVLTVIADFGHGDTLKILSNFEPTPLYYEYFLVADQDVPEINPLNPKYRLFIQAWKKMPLALANFIGPFIVKDLG